MKIRTRFILTFLVLAGLGFFLLVRSVTEELGPRYLAAMEESMVDMATVLAAYVETQSHDGAPGTDGLRPVFDAAKRAEFAAQIYEMRKTSLDLRVYVTDERGIVLFDSVDTANEGKDFSRFRDVTLTLRGGYGARTSPHFSVDPGTATLYVAAPVRIDGRIAGALTVAKPARSVSLFLATARRQVIGAGLLAGLCVIVLGTAVSLWIARPIGALTRYAIAVRDGRRAVPPRLGGSEIGRLGTAFEEMREKLEGKQYAEAYVQALTHEMKSPLSAIRAAAELLGEEMPEPQRRRFLDNIRNESARIQDLVDRLLQLSALENRRELREVETIDLCPLAHEIADSLEPVLRAAGSTIAIECPEPVAIPGERFLVRQALANLVANAVEFSPKGEPVRVAIATNGAAAEARVEDRGPGIPDYALDRVFDRFYSLRRPATGQKSSGLGLTFAREAARLHGGDVRIENVPTGGARAVLTLPLAPARSA